MATTSERSAAEVAHDYFTSIRHGDATPQREAYADDAVINVQGVLENAGRDELIAYFEEAWAAFPDFRFEVLDIIAEGDRAAAHWRMTGTFAGPGSFQGLEPIGARVDVRGVDVVTVRGGRIVRNDAYTDNATIAQQLGLMPPKDSPAQQRMTKAFNVRTRLAALGASGPEQIAEGVWLVRGGFPAKTMNVYLVRDGDGVLAFDAGIKAMRHAVAAAAAQLGGLTRIVLGHGHQDHRGVAPFLGVPVLCHADDRAIAEGDGGFSSFDFSKLNPLGRVLMPRLLKSWDGGPVHVAGTVAEGDDVAGFEVVHLPGHAAGLIGLWRESDRLALTSDCFYTLDPQTGRHGAPRVPHVAFNLDTEQARASMRKLAALEPAAAWPGHADPLSGDVRAQLERAAAAA
jgi:hydroxyacylglutathione hydrolase